MKKALISAGIAAAAVLGTGALNAPAQAFSVNLSGGNNFGSNPIEVALDFTDLGDNLKIDVRIVSDNTGNIADLRGFFFDLKRDDQAFLNTLSIINASAPISDVTFATNNVQNFGGGNNLNGGGTAAFDAGFSIGSSGIGNDDIRSLSFELASSAGPLDLYIFNKQMRAGVRATSVGTEGSSREGSSKIVGEVPTPALLPGLVGMAVAALRNKKEQDAEETA